MTNKEDIEILLRDIRHAEEILTNLKSRYESAVRERYGVTNSEAEEFSKSIRDYLRGQTPCVVHMVPEGETVCARCRAPVARVTVQPAVDVLGSNK